MKSYRGLGSDDTIEGGGAFVQEHGYGHEIFNFLPLDGYYYGFVETKQRNSIRNKINITKLGASKTDEYIDGVLVIWVAPDPESGTKIIGWFDNARVYRKEQESDDNRRLFKNEIFGFFVRAKVENCRLLSLDERIFSIPRKQKGGFGQSMLWYADQPEMEEFVQKVVDYVHTGKVESPKQVSPRFHRQLDPYKRIKIEKEAIKVITEYYEGLGYQVDSVEQDNAGWDLEAISGSKVLKLEVKGLSQDCIVIELTPNEYEKMNQNRDSYRICVVIKALSDSPDRVIFSYSPDSNCWEDDEGRKLKINEIHKVSARGYI